jgi:hypothetical protein
LSIELRLAKRHARGRATCAHSCDFSESGSTAVVLRGSTL